MMREKKREKRLNDRQLGAIGLNVHHKSLFLLYVDGAQFNQLLWYLLFLNIQKNKMEILETRRRLKKRDHSVGRV